jgi:small multidrug resistance family-3 protein
MLLGGVKNRYGRNSIDNVSDPDTALFVLTSIALSFAAALGGGYMIWKWLRERRGILFGIIGGLIFQPANFGRVYAAYGGIFIISSILWGMFIDETVLLMLITFELQSKPIPDEITCSR